jgi:RNA polymerase sigma factor (TIGR02999 family)
MRIGRRRASPEMSRGRRTAISVPRPVNGERTAPIEPDRDEVTRILDALGRGDGRAAGDLLPLVYAELRRLASQSLARETAGQTLQPTALVHEAYLRLVGDEPGRPWDGRGHFFAAAAEAMRRILVEAARRKGRHKRGGGLRRIGLTDRPAPDVAPDDDLLALDEALVRLAEEDPVAAKVVELRQFAGLGHVDVAESLGISVYAARQKWTYARAFLRDSLGRD